MDLDALSTRNQATLSLSPKIYIKVHEQVDYNKQLQIQFLDIVQITTVP